MNVWISCNTLLVHQVTKLRTKSWKLIELGALTNGLTIVTSRLFLAISNFIYQKERSFVDCFLSSTLDRKKLQNRLTCEQALGALWRRGDKGGTARRLEQAKC